MGTENYAGSSVIITLDTTLVLRSIRNAAGAHIERNVQYHSDYTRAKATGNTNPYSSLLRIEVAAIYDDAGSGTQGVFCDLLALGATANCILAHARKGWTDEARERALSAARSADENDDKKLVT
jgi:hypothetical protein